MKRFLLLGFTSTMLLSSSVPVLGQDYIQIENGHKNEVYYDYRNTGYTASVSEEEILKFDRYVILENNVFIISEEGYEVLSQNDLDRLNEILINTNLNIEISQSLSKYHFIENNTIILTDSNILQRNRGVNAVTHHWWGARIHISANTLNTFGNGVTIAGIWIPHPMAAKATATLGVVMPVTNRGIWFDINPLAHMVPSSMFGVGFQ